LTTRSRIAGDRRGAPRARAVALACAALALAGCRNDMQDQPRYEVNSASRFFADGRADRPLVKGVVARGSIVDDPVLELGKSPDGAFVATVPLPVTRDLMMRGRDRYNVYCSPCHARTGDGEGMIVLRGYKRPPSFHIDRLRSAPDGYFYDTIANGFGVMPSYAAQIPVRDRWAITAYVRALQLSQHATLADVDPEARRRLESGESAAAPGAPGGGAHGGGDAGPRGRD
jgi:hypothetical protein